VSKVTEKIKTRSKPTPSENFKSHPLYVWRNFVMLGLLVEKPLAERSRKRTPEIVADVAARPVAARMEQSPKKKPRRLAEEMDLSYGTCQKILKQDLNFHSYKITVVQELLPRHFPTRIRYCQWFLNRLNL
jgi:hypothetical protein